MKRSIIALLMAALCLTATACSGSSADAEKAAAEMAAKMEDSLKKAEAEAKAAEAKANEAAAAAPAEKPAEPAPAAAEPSAEMKDFLGGFGSSDQVEAALKKHGVEGLETGDMEMYDLKEPKVVATNGACYDFEAKAGMTVRTYEVCWAEGKINKVTDKGMR
ncbi:MAG: hypothetical protein KC620_00920 [Myxococcales bacterium]|nr:hypothetical protein [Myxococcales bacterium]